MKERKIDITELRQMSIYVKNRSRAIRTQLNNLRRAFQDVVKSAGMVGGAKDAFDNNIIYVYIPIIDAFEEMYHELDDTVTRMLDNVQEHMVEHASNGVINQMAVHNYKNAVNDHHTTVQELSQGLQAAYNKIGDLAPVSMPSRAPYDAVRISLTNELTQVSDRLDSLEINLTSLDDLYNMVRREVNRVNNEVGTRDDSNWAISPISGFTDHVRGLRQARQQAARFEGSFSMFGHRGGWVFCEIWKGEHADQAFANYLETSIQDRTMSLVETFIDADGNIDLDKVGRNLFDPGVLKGFTVTQWNALIQILGSNSLSHEDIVDLFHGVAWRRAGWLAELSDHNVFISFQHLDSVFGNISAEFNDLLAEAADRDIWGLNHQKLNNEALLHQNLRRAQLINFVACVGSEIMAGSNSRWNFDFSDFNHRNNGYLKFNGERFNVSGMDALRGRDWNDEFSSSRLSTDFYNNNKALTDWVDALVKGADFAFTYFTPVGKALSIRRSAWNLSQYIHKALLHESGASALEAAYLTNRLVLGDSRLGRSVVTVETPNGLVHMGSLETQQSILRSAGLADTFNGENGEPLTIEGIQYILLRENHGRYGAITSHLRYTYDSSGAHYRYANSLRRIIRDNQDLFPEIPEFYFEEGIAIPLDHLPSAVLERIFELKEQGFDVE